MIVEKDQDTIRLMADENTVSNFFIVFKEKYSNFEGANLIIDFSDLKGVKTENLILFYNFQKIIETMARLLL